MNEKTKKTLKIIGLIVFGIAFVASVILLFCGNNQTVNNVGSIASTITATIEVSLALTFNIDIKVNKTVNSTVNKHVEKIKNEYDIKVEDNYKQIISLKNELNIKNYQIEKIVNNFNQPSQQLPNPDDSLYNEMKSLYDPIEEFLVNNGGFGAPFINSMFVNLMLYAETCTLNKYKFVDSSLNSIQEKLKISTCELAEILCKYSYPLESNSGISKFEYLDIINKISYMPEAYSQAKVTEHEAKFKRANELLTEIVTGYRALDDQYKELRFKHE